MSTHLLIDAKNVEHAFKLTDEESIRNLIIWLMVALDLNPIGPTSLIHFPADANHERGLTAFQILSESHFSYHSYSERDGFAIDLYSCKPFNHALCDQIIRTTFGAGTYSSKVIGRDHFIESERLPGFEHLTDSDSDSSDDGAYFQF